MKFSKLYDEFIDLKSLKLKPQSLRSLKSRFENYILPYFKDKNIEDITTNDYIKWQKKIEKLGFKYSYKKQLHYAFVSLYDFVAITKGYTVSIPKIIGNFRNDEIGHTINTWNHKEFKIFENSFSNEDIIYKTFFVLLFRTGLRVGEALALTFKDINNNILHITKTLSKEHYNGQKIITSPKSHASIRSIKIDDYLLKCLTELKEYYKKKFWSYNDNFNIFGGPKYISITTINRKKKYYCELCNLQNIRIHDFRHSHATLLLQNGISMIEVSRRLGHSDINMTIKTYAHCEKEYEKRVLETLNSLN